MKNISYIKVAFVFLAAVMFSACEDENLGLENVGLDGFATDQSGSFITIGGGGETEEGGSVGIAVSLPNPITSDVTFTFSLGGNAVAGEDYTLTGATLSGTTGSGTIVQAVTAGGADVLNFTVDFLFDGVAEAEADSVIITLTGATAANGTQIDLGDPTENVGGSPTLSVVAKVTDATVNPGWAVEDLSANEVSDDTTSVDFYFVVPGGLPDGASIDVEYSLANTTGGAVDTDDYTLRQFSAAGVGTVITTTGTIEAFSGDSVRFNIEVFPDELSDEDELVLTITSAAANEDGLTVTLDTDALTIDLQDDSEVVSFASETADVLLAAAPADVPTTYLFDVVLTDTLDVDATVNFTLDAVAGISSLSGTSLTLEAGEVAGTIVVEIDHAVVFAGSEDVMASLELTSVVSADEEVEVSSTDSSRTITIDNTP